MAAYVALREDLIWALTDDQLHRLTTLTPDDLDGGRGDWALAVAEAYRLLGDSSRSRAYGDTAASAYAAQIAGWGDRADRGQMVAVRALALAHAGRLADALAQAKRAGSIQPLDSGTQGTYVAYVQSRVAVMAGDRRWALELLHAIVQRPAQISRGWIAIDRTLAPLRDDPSTRHWSATSTEPPGPVGSHPWSMGSHPADMLLPPGRLSAVAPAGDLGEAAAGRAVHRVNLHLARPVAGEGDPGAVGDQAGLRSFRSALVSRFTTLVERLRV